MPQLLPIQTEFLSSQQSTTIQIYPRLKRRSHSISFGLTKRFCLSFTTKHKKPQTTRTMGNTLDKPLPYEEDAPLDSSRIPAHFLDEEDDDDDDWYSTSSMGSQTDQSPTAVTAVEELFLVNNNSSSSNPMIVNNSHHHGVRALREAAAERQRKRQQHGCARLAIQQSPWWQALFPKQPLLTAVHHNNNMDNMFDNDDDENDGYTSSSSASASQQPTQQTTPRKNKQDTGTASTPLTVTSMEESITCSPSSRDRSGMMLWTSRSCAASPPSSSSTWFPDEMDYTPHEQTLSAVEPTKASDLTQPRHVWIVTTAALPWMT